MERVHLSILLAEDDADDALITRSVLNDIDELRVDLDWVSTFEAAAEQIWDNQHDLYLLDYSLGCRTGLDLLKMATQRGCNVPIIMLTGHTANEIILEAIHCGATDYLVKGQFDAQSLGRSIRYSIERKKTEAALRVSEEKHRKLLENATEMVLSYDWQGRVTAANPSAERMTGFGREELIGMNLSALLTTDSMIALDEVHVRQMAGESTEACRLAMLQKSGGVFGVELSSSLITDGRRPIEFQAIARCAPA